MDLLTPVDAQAYLAAHALTPPQRAVYEALCGVLADAPEGLDLLRPMTELMGTVLFCGLMDQASPDPEAGADAIEAWIMELRTLVLAHLLVAQVPDEPEDP